MSLSIYTYSNPYEINNEPYWDSIRNCAHFCVSQTMVNGLSAVYDELDNGQLATVARLEEVEKIESTRACLKNILSCSF